jgi:hypothetical protein
VSAAPVDLRAVLPRLRRVVLRDSKRVLRALDRDAIALPLLALLCFVCGAFATALVYGLSVPVWAGALAVLLLAFLALYLVAWVGSPVLRPSGASP